MVDTSQLEQRLRQLEQSRYNATRWLLAGAAVVSLVVMGMLLVQVILLQRQVAALHEQTLPHQFWTLCQPTSSRAQRTTAFTRLVDAGHTEWRSAVTQELTLRDSVLDGAVLRVADLSACDLREASLRKTDLTGARLRTADLTGADLTEATLDGAECLKATLDRADFHKALLRSASLEQCSAAEARFVLADLSEALLLMADLTGADLTGANLTAANLESASFRGANLILANLAEADLTNADFTDSNWWRARGLTGDQLILFVADFAPTDAAEPSRIEDFLLWAEGFEESTSPVSDDRDAAP